MARLQIEGDISQISERQLEYIKRVIAERGYNDNKVIIEPVGQAGDNYIANVKRIAVHSDQGVFKAVVKVAPNQAMIRQMTNAEPLFRNEHIMYTKVLPKFTELEILSGIPPEERLRYAICYGSSQDTPDEVIILEDLKESNFIMLDRFRPIGTECIKSVIKNFALLHSLSFALKYKEPEAYNEFKDSLFDLWQNLGSQEDAKRYFQHVEASASTIVDRSDHKKAVTGAVTSSLKDLTKLARFDKDSKHSVIQQGDAWTNNIMFRFEGDNLKESLLIDYQVSKPTNPVADLLYMIFNCTDYDMRKKHFYEWIDYYHTELEKALSNHGLKANFVYPKDQLDVDLRRYGKTNFGQCIILAVTLSMKSEDVSNVKAAMESAGDTKVENDINLTERNSESVSIFKKRITDLIDSCRDFGLLA